MLKPWIRFAPLRAPEAEAGTGTPPAEGAAPPAGATPPAEAATPPAEGATPPAGGTDKTWWESDALKEHREFLTARGFIDIKDPQEALVRAIKGHHAAEQRLGRPADAILDKPKDGQDVGEWLRANGAVFGIPESPDKYEIEAPDLPEGMAWDQDFEAKARAIAHEEGISGKALNRLVGAYAERFKSVFEDAGTQLQTAQAEMMAQLQRDWGGQTQEKVALAQRAAQTVAEKAGLDHDALAGVAAVLRDKVGDAGTLKLFATIGGMMGEDSLITGGRSAAFGTTPAEAKAELERMDSPEGDYGRAYKAGDTRRMKELEPKRQQLIKIAAGQG